MLHFPDMSCADDALCLGFDKLNKLLKKFKSGQATRQQTFAEFEKLKQTYPDLIAHNMVFKHVSRINFCYDKI